MFDAHDGHSLSCVINLVENAIIAHTDAPAFQLSKWLERAGRTRIITQGQDLGIEPLQDSAEKPAQVLFSGGLEERVVHRLAFIKVELCRKAHFGSKVCIWACWFVGSRFQTEQVGEVLQLLKQLLIAFIIDQYNDGTAMLGDVDRITLFLDGIDDGPGLAPQVTNCIIFVPIVITLFNAISVITLHDNYARFGELVNSWSSASLLCLGTGTQERCHCEKHHPPAEL